MHNHQFISSLTPPKVPTNYISNILDVINSHKLVSIVYDNNKHLTEGSPQSRIRQLSSQKSSNSLKSDISMFGDILCIRIKFFIVTNDYSCMLMLKNPNYGGRQINRDLTLKSYKEPSFLERKRSASKKIQGGEQDK